MSHDLFRSSTDEIADQFSQIRAGGVSWVREDLSWDVAEPARGSYDWGPFDRLMEAASRTRVHVLGILDYSTPWSSSDPSGRGDTLFPPAHDADFAAYASAVASRYGSRGTFWKSRPDLVPAPLAAVEIWNEPYGTWFWKSGPDPAAYAAMVRATAPAVHAADPQMQVLMSGDLLSSDPGGAGFQPWLARLLAADPGIASQVDAIAVHPYPEPRTLGPYDEGADTTQSFGRVSLIRKTELAAGVSLPIWITEVGWSTAPHSAAAVSEARQSEFVSGAVRRSVEEWGSYVPRIFIFGWYRSSGASGSDEYNCGLIDPDGGLTPAWVDLAHLLGGTPGAPDPAASLSN